MTGDLTSTVGLIALAAALVATVALIACVILAFKLRALRSAQKLVLGDLGSRDVVAHAKQVQDGFVALREFVDTTFSNAEARFAEHEHRLGRAISHAALVRYDAYGEMSGQQSSSMALLDDHGNGLVLSSILHREQARMYVKDVHGGRSGLELSPEETEAIAVALGSRSQGDSKLAGTSGTAT